VENHNFYISSVYDLMPALTIFPSEFCQNTWEWGTKNAKANIHRTITSSSENQ